MCFVVSFAEHKRQLGLQVLGIGGQVGGLKPSGHRTLESPRELHMLLGTQFLSRPRLWT